MIPNIRSEPAAGPPPIDTPPSAPVDVVVVDVPGRPGRRRDLRLTVRQSHARVADLAAAVGLRGAAALCVDGLPHPAERPLAVVGLRRGATIAGVATGADGALTEAAGDAMTRTARVDRDQVAAAPAAGIVLRTLRGPDAGREISLLPGRLVVGTAEGVDVRLEDRMVARRHAWLDVDPSGAVTLTDLAPGRPSRRAELTVDGVTALEPGETVQLGATLVELVPSTTDGDVRSVRSIVPGAPEAPQAIGGRRHRGSRDADEAWPSVPARPGPWTFPVCRPPLSVVSPAVSPVVLPWSEDVSPAPSPVGLAAVIATLIAGVAAALVVRQPAFLVLGAVGAAGSLGAALWQRGRHRSRRRRARRGRQGAVDRFRLDLAAHQLEVADRLRRETLELPDALSLLRWQCRAPAPGAAATGLWGRRPSEPGSFAATVGRGARVLPPTIADESAGPQGGRRRPLDGRAAGRSGDDEVWALVEASALVPDVPVTIDLGPGAVIGVVGDEPVARSLVRGIVLQLAVALGPADLLVGAIARASEVEWLRWLPHAIEPVSGGSLALASAHPGAVDELVARLEAVTATVTPDGRAAHVVLVVDDPTLLLSRSAPLRRLLVRAGGAITPLVLARTRTELPSITTVVLAAGADASTSISRPGSAELADRVWAAGAALATAEEAALTLAGWHDPEQSRTIAGLSDELGLLELLELGGVDGVQAERIRDRWAAAGADPPPRARVAMAADGPVEVDLVRDGPHALIAGTTGSGKSELLRSLVVALAVSSCPDHLAFILVDYKGGSAFDACARLPHVVGLVTDLDERLAARALRSLHAELRRRERLFRDVGCSDLREYRAACGRPPLARLVVVVDEFATLATDLPDFVTSLVGVAQRGRSLGVHLVLATQRPAGAVSDDIRANTNLRIALRTLDAAESIDVIGARDAADLPRQRPGSALVRFGPGELVAVQMAAVTVASTPSGQEAVSASVIDDLSRGQEQPGAARTALEAIVGASVEAAGWRDATSSGAVPPWWPPLPDEVPADAVPLGAVGLVDDPDHQEQGPWSWAPSGGHLICCGALGAGVTTALAAVTLALASTRSPEDLHLYVVHGGSGLAALEGLPHVGASIAPSEEERHARLIGHLGAVLAERTHRSAGSDADRHLILLVVDQLAGWRTAVADRLGPELLDQLDRILIDGPKLGVVVAGGLDRPGALPLGVSGAVGDRLVFRLADGADALAAGVSPAAVKALPAGRAVLARSGLELQVRHVDDLPGEVATLAARTTSGGPGAPAIRTLPRQVHVTDLPRVGPMNRPWSLPIGVGGDCLEPVTLPLHAGDHLLVTGPARSGKSSALALLTTQIRRACPSARIVGLAPRRSGLHTGGPLDEVVATPEDLPAPGVAPHSPLIVVVDDAELLEDPGQVLAGLLSGAPDAHVIAAGRSDALRMAYGHWTQLVRRQRRGLVLRPQDDLDTDVLGVVLPRRPFVPSAVGRGYLVADGAQVLVQLATCGPRITDEHETADSVRDD